MRLCRFLPPWARSRATTNRAREHGTLTSVTTAIVAVTVAAVPPSDHPRRRSSPPRLVRSSSSELRALDAAAAAAAAAAADDDDSSVAIIMFSENPHFPGIASPSLSPSLPLASERFKIIITKKSNLLLCNTVNCCLLHIISSFVLGKR